MTANGKIIRNLLLTLAGLGLVALFLFWVEGTGSRRMNDAVALFAILGIAAVSLNLINGVTGILSLGHHGFMLIGGYTTALLVLPEAARERILDSARSQMTPTTLGLSMSNWLSALGLDVLTTPETMWVRFLLSLLVGGFVAMLFGLIVGIPSLRLRGDYLAIVTFGFGEIIRLLAATSLLASFTNGALGFAGVPSVLFGKNIWFVFPLLAATVFVLLKLKYSSYGRALQGIREDEVAAQAMGVNTAYHKVLAFAISAFFAGVAGGLYVSWLGTARLESFLFVITFFLLVAISVGGTGSFTGVLLGTALVIFVRQYGDPLEEAYPLTTWLTLAGGALVLAALGTLLLRHIQRLRPRFNRGIAVLGGLGLLAIVFALLAPAFGLLEGSWRGFGMRAILLSILLIVIMIFRPSGIMGSSEFNWAALFGERRDKPSDEERAQDAWLTNPALNKDKTAALSDKNAPTRPPRSGDREV
jgi:branched-chain amino acid transport system permease protein